MILLCLLIAFALEFYFKIGSEYRGFSWFDKVTKFLTDTFSDNSFFEWWGGIAIILLTPIILLYGLMHIFEGAVFWLIMFGVSAVILFLCLGPKPLEETFDDYFAAMDRDDLEAAYLHLNKIGETSRVSDETETVANNDVNANIVEASEKDELVRAATRKILTESQKRYFGVIAWFIIFGPLGALFYRLSYLYRDHCAAEEFDEHLPLMEQFIHWIDWVPARLTSMLFLLTGDFSNGFYRIKDYLSDADADSNQLISETGIAALSLEMGVSDGDVEENHRTMDMINRTIIFYLVVGAAVSIVV